MANLLQFYYDSKRGKKGQCLSIGQFTMYDDIVKHDEDPAGPAALQRALGG